MKLIIIMSSLVVYTLAQRPSYAGTGPIGRPSLASRFQETNAESSTVAVNNRVGEDGSTQKIPVDARGDYDLVDRLNQWPRENRPFWLLNAQHIEAARNPQNSGLANRNNFQPGGSIPAVPTSHRSSFLGSINK